MKNSLKSIIGVFVVIMLGAFFYLYKLDVTALAPWDEAWYAVISRNLIKSGSWFELEYMNKPFWDHPPLGFMLMKISYLILGINELSTRFPMALAGIGTLLVTYVVGKKTFGVKAGLMAMMVVLSSRWFLMRARTGNLDMLLCFFQALTFYFFVQKRNPTNLVMMWAAWAFAMLSKSTISITIMPIVILGTIEYLWRKQNWRYIPLALFVFLVIFTPWFQYNITKYGQEFINRHFLFIGLRGASSEGVGVEAWSKVLLYWRSAIHKWYWPMIFGFVGGVVLTPFSLNTRRTLLFFVLTFAPYFLSTQTEIWHLLPTIVPGAILLVSVFFEVIQIINKKLVNSGNVFGLLSLLFFTVVTSWSIKDYWSSIIDAKPDFVGQVKLAQEASEYEYRLVTTNDTFYPSVYFYADKIPMTIEPIDGPKKVDGWNDTYLLMTDNPLLVPKKYTEIAVEGNMRLLKVN